MLGESGGIVDGGAVLGLSGNISGDLNGVISADGDPQSLQHRAGGHGEPRIGGGDGNGKGHYDHQSQSRELKDMIFLHAAVRLLS